MSTIAGGTCIHHLNLLLEFLAAWEKRPECLTQMVFQWCSTISDVVGRLRPGETQIEPPYYLEFCAEHNVRLRPQDIVGACSILAATLFSAVRSDRDSGGSDATHSQVQYSLPRVLYEYLLSILLEVGFRLAGIDTRFGNIHPDDTSHHNWIFETAFSSDDDEMVADAVRMWITSTSRTSLGSFARHFTKRLEKDRPLSEGLRKPIIRVVERIWDSGPWESGPETVRLLSCLNANLDGLGEYQRVDLLGCVVRGPGGLELSLPYWGLLDELVVVEGNYWDPESGDWDIMRALWEAEYWEKLEVWMLVMWKSLLWYGTPESMEDIQRVTLDLLSRRPLALQRFKNICGEETSDKEESSNGEESNDGEEESNYNPKRVLQDICKRAQAENPPSEDSPGLPYVFLQPAGTYLF